MEIYGTYELLDLSSYDEEDDSYPTEYYELNGVIMQEEYFNPLEEYLSISSSIYINKRIRFDDYDDNDVYITITGPIVKNCFGDLEFKPEYVYGEASTWEESTEIEIDSKLFIGKINSILNKSEIKQNFKV